jgi:hypothetical protein
MFVVEGYRFSTLTKLYLSLIVVNYQWGLADNFTEINLPKEHIPYYFNSYPEVAEKCRLDAACPYKVSIHLEHIEVYVSTIMKFACVVQSYHFNTVKLSMKLKVC